MIKRHFKDHWWEAPKDVVHEHVFSNIDQLDEWQSYKYDQNLHHLRLYSSRLAEGLGSTNYATSQGGERIRINVIRSVIDTATAHIATNKPKPMPLSIGGDYSLQKKAKALGKFLSGQFYATDQYSLSQTIFRDACIFGTGIQKVYEEGGKIKCERVFPNELIVDDREAKYGDPQSIYQHKEVDKTVLGKAFPRFKDDIHDCKHLRVGYETDDGLNMADIASVFEAWHLPPGPGAKGRHVICVSNATLVDEPWERDKFPFAVFRWGEPPLGYFGIGLAEELNPIQTEINYILQKIQALMNASTTNVWVEEGSDVNVGGLNNKNYAVRKYKGQMPVFAPMPTAHPDFFRHLDALINRAYEVAGVSQMSAAAQKPSGLNSGEALRVYHDIGSKRFAHVGQRYEEYHLCVADLMLDCAREIDERGDGDIKVLAQGDRDIQQISFKEVRLDQDQYSLRVFPTSLLPETPAGKLQTIKELAEISPDLQKYVMQLLDFPDLEGVTNLITAPTKLIDHIIERILDHGEFTPPTPYMNLATARHKGTLALAQAQVNKVPEERVELLRRFLDQIDMLEAPPMPAAQMATGEAPGEAPLMDQPVPVQGMGTGDALPPPPGMGPVPQ